MGSRRGRHAALIACLGTAACAAGPPSGFSHGDRWVFPLVGPVEDGLLIVPVTIDDKGPFLLAIDPDSAVSNVDAEVVQLAGLHTTDGPPRLDETDTPQRRPYAAVTSVQLGTLTVEGRPMMVVPAGTYDADGRRIHGVIGRDVLADSLVFGFDRDLGLGYLTTQRAFKTPPGAVSLPFALQPGHGQTAANDPVPRRLITASSGPSSFTMHLDLGARMSQLRESLWAKAQLEPIAIEARVVDEVGTPRDVKQAAVGSGIVVNGSRRERVVFLPYADRRWEDEDLDGSLGLDFFGPYDVWVSWSDSTFYLKPRSASTAGAKERIERWGAATLATCAHVGCATVSLIDPLAGKPPATGQHPGVVVSVARDAEAAGHDLEVVLAPHAADGTTRLAWLVVNMPPGVDRVFEHLHPEYVGATLEVVDASPFPRTCPGQGGCVDFLEAPRSAAAAPAKSPASLDGRR